MIKVLGASIHQRWQAPTKGREVYVSKPVDMQIE